mgnify:CR=1 FL=1
MSQINRPPIGLQGLLGSQNFGTNPSELSQIVSPGIDLFPFWASQGLKFDKQTGSAAGVGSLIETQVPDGKTWAVLSCAFLCDDPTANADRIQWIAIDENATGTDYFVVAVENFGGAIDDALFRTVIWRPSPLFWLPPKFVIRGVLDTAQAGVSRDFELHTVYYEIDV